MSTRTGYTTGACAAAATQGAACLLAHRSVPSVSQIVSPTGTVLKIPILSSGQTDGNVFASVQKDAGDDQDVTHGAIVTVQLETKRLGGIQFRAGSGVGIVTRKGLSVAPGEPAINPKPREMIRSVLREAGVQHAVVTICVENGETLAYQTFNHRLGVEGGLSILGTTGIVRPKCQAALKRTIELAIAVANAEFPGKMFMVPGNIGAAAAANIFDASPCQIVEVENHWGFAIDAIPDTQQGVLHLVGHPGKLVKLAKGNWYTHSASSESVAEDMAAAANSLGFQVPSSPNTCEEVIAALSPVEGRIACGYWCNAIREAVMLRLSSKVLRRNLEVAVTLVSMNGKVVASTVADSTRRHP